MGVVGVVGVVPLGVLVRVVVLVLVDRVMSLKARDCTLTHLFSPQALAHFIQKVQLALPDLVDGHGELQTQLRQGLISSELLCAPVAAHLLANCKEPMHRNRSSSCLQAT